MRLNTGNPNGQIRLLLVQLLLLALVELLG